MRAKIRFAAWIAVLLLCLEGCTYGQNTAENNGNTNIENDADTDTDTAQDTEKDLPYLKIGSSIFAPYFYVYKDGGYAGIDVDIAKEACKRMGYTPVFAEIIWGEHDTLLKEKMIDCIWCSFSMNGREREYQWAGPYLYSPEVVMVSADSEIESLSDLEGKSVAVEVDSRPEAYFLESEEGTALNVKSVQTYSSLEDAFTSFGKGYTDAVAGHKAALEQFTSQNAQLYRYLSPAIIQAKLGVAFSLENDSGIVEKLTETLEEMERDGTISEIISKYGISQEMLVEEGTYEEE